MERSTRELTPAEYRLIRMHLRHFSKLRDQHWRRIILVALAVFSLLWILTLLVSDSSVLVVTLFWASVGTLITFWVGKSEWRPSNEQLFLLEEALRQGFASVTRFTCLKYAEIQEEEDEGAALILELPGRQVTFFSGQENYPTPRFPGTSVEFIQIRTGAGQTVLSVRRSRGARLTASRLIDPSVKKVMYWPGDGQVLPGTLDDLDKILQISLET